jgi:Protein of unknown function, DUF547
VHFRLVFCLAFFAARAFAFDHSHPLFTQVLAKYLVADGRVKYRTLKADVTSQPKHPLLQYLSETSELKKAEYETFSNEQKMAFLINSYNAFTLKLVIDHYPVKSIKDIGSLFKSPWKKEFFSLLEGEIKTLDAIEHDYLRAQFKDARIHAAINCASLSCPRLQPVAFTADKLGAQLDSAALEWLNDPARNHFDKTSHTMTLSKIFNWFEKDFVHGYGGISGFIKKFGPPLAKDLAIQKAKIKFLTYDWKLNEA